MNLGCTLTRTELRDVSDLCLATTQTVPKPINCNFWLESHVIQGYLNHKPAYVYYQGQN